MKSYIGTKVVKAEKMLMSEFLTKMGKHNESTERELQDYYVYLVEYEDGYISHSPQEVFERCYREITPKEKELI